MWKLKKDDDLNYYYFEDENGNRSKDTYEFALPYSKEGFALVQKESGKGYYFRNKDGKLSQRFNDAKHFSEDGRAIVRKTKNSPYQFMDAKGSLSEMSFAWINSSSSEGFRRVQEYGNGPYKFVDAEGCLSSDCWGDASDYKEGFAVVREKYMGNGNQWFRNAQGELSEPFDVALAYNKNGYAIVRCLGENKFRLRDRVGNLSEDSYANIERIHSFFSPLPDYFYIVNVDKDSPIQYRDLLGNLSDEPTQKGEDYYKYINDVKSVFDLDPSCFADDKFLKIIMEREQNMLMQASEHCDTEEDMRKLGELAEYVAEYIRDMAYDAHVKAEEEKAAIEKILKVENDRKDLQEKIEKMF